MSKLPPDAGRFSDMILHVASARSGAGGHIFDNEKRASLCGIEKRFPTLEHEEGVNEPFREWYTLNEPWICRRCHSAHRKLTCVAPLE